MTKATSLDVARLAGVSRSAVSRTFTDGASVAPETRARVIAAAERLGYRVNLLARGLKDRRTRLVGLIVSDMEHSMRAALVDSLSRSLVRADFRPFLLPVDAEDDMTHTVDMMLHYNLSGAILTSDASPDAIARGCARHGLPLVLLNKAATDDCCATIRHDTELAGQLAAQALADAGCRRVAALRAERPSFTIQRRARAFAAHAATLGLRVSEHVTPGRHNYAGGVAAGRAFLEAGLRVDGVHCANDFLALGFLDTLRRGGGPRVPQDMAVVGCDDIAEAAWGAYDLTTIRQSVPDLTAAAMAALTARLDDPSAPPVHRVLPVTLVPRATTQRP